MRDRQRVVQIIKFSIVSPSVPPVNEKIDSSPLFTKPKCVSSVLNKISVVCVCLFVFLCVISFIQQTRYSFQGIPTSLYSIYKNILSLLYEKYYYSFDIRTIFLCKEYFLKVNKHSTHYCQMIVSKIPHCQMNISKITHFQINVSKITHCQMNVSTITYCQISLF